MEPLFFSIIFSINNKKLFPSTFSNIHLLFLQKGCSAAHESVFFKHPSVQEITQLQFPFPAIWNWKERQRQQHASIDPTSCQREKLLFEFKKGFYISFWKKAHLELVSVYPTYPFTFYVNRTKRHVSWSICPHTLLFNTTRPKPAYGRQGLDWIVGPGYSFTYTFLSLTGGYNQPVISKWSFFVVYTLFVTHVRIRPAC